MNSEQQQNKKDKSNSMFDKYKSFYTSSFALVYRLLFFFYMNKKEGKNESMKIKTKLKKIIRKK